MVDIDKMQYEFLPGKGTDDTVFVLRRFKKNDIQKKTMFFIFVDLEKAFDWDSEVIPRELFQ